MVETQMLARLLSRTAPGPARLQSGVKRIDASAKRMMDMLEMLTEMSRIALGSLDLHLGEANLEEIVSDVLIHCATEDAGRTLVRVRPEANLTGVWDRTRLMQVVENLLSNAFKYSASGTPVEIDLDADEDTAMLVIRDQGIGIPAEELRAIFSRYQRSSNAVKDGIEGLGLGLYLCKGIVEAHDGQIEAESGGHGEGTTIRVTLPRRANQEREG